MSLGFVRRKRIPRCATPSHHVSVLSGVLPEGFDTHPEWVASGKRHRVFGNPVDLSTLRPESDAAFTGRGGYAFDAEVDELRRDLGGEPALHVEPHAPRHDVIGSALEFEVARRGEIVGECVAEPKSSEIGFEVVRVAAVHRSDEYHGVPP